MKYLPLTNADEHTLVDDDVYEWAKAFKWHKDHYGYAARNAGHGRKNRRISLLHREILVNPLPGQVRDHINQNKLDNRRENLRFVSKKLNNLNSKIKKGYGKHAGKWRVRFKVRGILLDVSGLGTEEEAKSIAALLRASLIYHELTKGEVIL